jgi:hypothetical protein
VKQLVSAFHLVDFQHISSSSRRERFHCYCFDDGGDDDGDGITLMTISDVLSTFCRLSHLAFLTLRESYYNLYHTWYKKFFLNTVLEDRTIPAGTG